MALPPWVVPQEKDGRFLMDGGAVSNLPIEAALQQGATEIIALDLFNPREEDDSTSLRLASVPMEAGPHHGKPAT